MCLYKATNSLHFNRNIWEILDSIERRMLEVCYTILSYYLWLTILSFSFMINFSISLSPSVWLQNTGTDTYKDNLSYSKSSILCHKKLATALPEYNVLMSLDKHLTAKMLLKVFCPNLFLNSDFSILSLEHPLSAWALQGGNVKIKSTMASKYEISTELLSLVAVCKQWVYQG